MIFRGWQKISLLEWPDKICTVLFVGGCNFVCPWCYNQVLVQRPEQMPPIDEKEVLNYLQENKKFFDGVMISGGEPTILFEAQGVKATERKDKIARPARAELRRGGGGRDDELVKFIKKIRALGLGVGIETNGSNPDFLEYLLKNKLLDYVAMDIKAPIGAQSQKSKIKNQNGRLEFKNKYSQLAGVNVDLDKIKKSIELIKELAPDYEFRTTVVPGLLTKDDILDIADYIRGAKRYYLQEFQGHLVPKWKTPSTLKEVQSELNDKLKDLFPIFKVRA